MKLFRWLMSLLRMILGLKTETETTPVDPSVPHNIDTTPGKPEEPVMAGKKYALIIGINKYMVPNADLNGCVNDAEDMWKELTTHYGLDQDNVRMLTNFRVTKQKSLERVDWLV